MNFLSMIFNSRYVILYAFLISVIVAGQWKFSRMKMEISELEAQKSELIVDAERLSLVVEAVESQNKLLHSLLKKQAETLQKRDDHLIKIKQRALSLTQQLKQEKQRNEAYRKWSETQLPAVVIGVLNDSGNPDSNTD